MNSDIRIAHWTVGDIRKSLDQLRSLDDHYGQLADFGEPWRDLVISNPLATDDDLALSLVLDGHRVIGRLAYYAGHYLYHGEIGKTFWLQALVVEPSYQSSGIGGALLLEAKRRLASFAGSGRPSEKAWRIYLAMGAQDVGPLRRFVALLEPESILHRYVSFSPLVPVLAAFVRPMLWLYHAFKLRKLGSEKSLVFEPVDRFSAGIDHLLLADPRNQLLRTVATLNWALAHRPFLAFQITKDARLVGYALFKKADVPVVGARRAQLTSVLYLADFYLEGDSPATRSELLSFSLALARESRVHRFETQVRGDVLEEVCCSVGLMELEGNVAFLKPARDHLDNQSNPAGWFLTLASADVVLSLGQDDTQGSP